MSKPFFVKYHRNLFCQAQKQGLLTSLVAFYKLKTLNIEGSILRKGSIVLLSKTLLLSQSQVYITINKLRDLKWIRLSKTHLSLTSLDSVVTSLGLDPSKNKRWKIRGELSDSFHEIFGLTEISYSLFLQQKVINKEIKLSEKKSDTEKKPREVFLEAKQAEQRHLIRAHLSNNFTQNWFNTLSTFKVATLLGYSSPMSSWNFLKSLEKQKLIKYAKTKAVYIGKVFNESEFKSLDLEPSFILSKKNIIFKIMSNQITIL